NKIANLTSFFLLKFPISDVDDINTLSAPDPSAIYNARRAMADYVGAIDPSRRNEVNDYDYPLMLRNFDLDVLSLIRKYPDVRFDIYFPPYSILHWAVLRDAAPAPLNVVYDFCAYVNLELTKLPNVQLHDFRAEKDITHDLRNYADVVHHSPTIDLRVLAMLASGQYLVDRSSPTTSLEQLKEQVKA